MKNITLPTGIAINTRTWGPESGIPVIALHGWMDNTATFERLAPLLPQCRIVAMDVPGHGLSDHLPGCTDYSVHYIPPYVMAVADALGWQQFSIIGHSMGGVVGQLIAATYPERVQRLALLDIFGLFSQPAQAIVAQLRANYDDFFTTFKANQVYPNLEVAAKVRKANGDLSLDSAALLARGGMREVEGGYVWAFDPRIRKRTDIRMTNQQLLAVLGQIAAPVSVVVADRGIFEQVHHDHAHFNAVKNLTTHRVKGGHHVHLDDPQPVAKLLVNFFQSS